MRIHWKPALTFMFESAVIDRALFWGGLLFLICPPFGWPVALGYRSLVMRGLLETGEVPEIRIPGETGRCFRSGLGAIAVIFCYFLPFMLLYWAFAAGMGELTEHVPEICLFFGSILFFVPLFLPTVPVAFEWYFPWIDHSSGEKAILALVFFVTTSVMPAVFLQVSLQGSYWGATRVTSALSTIVRHPREYAEAWAVSLGLVSLSFIFFPFFTWITFWAYLAIGVLFNNVLLFDGRDAVKKRMERLRIRLRGDTLD